MRSAPAEARITKAPLLLIDLETEEGITGRSYLFCCLLPSARAIAAMLDEAGAVVARRRCAAAELWSKLAKRFALIGVQGVARMAMAGLDVAAWDALAIAAGMPLVTLLGSKPEPIPAYNCCGLGLMTSPDEVPTRPRSCSPTGSPRVKLRLGYPTWQDDLAALRAVRGRIGDAIAADGRLQPGALRSGGARTRACARR